MNESPSVLVCPYCRNPREVRTIISVYPLEDPVMAQFLFECPECSQIIRRDIHPLTREERVILKGEKGEILVRD